MSQRVSAARGATRLKRLTFVHRRAVQQPGRAGVGHSGRRVLAAAAFPVTLGWNVSPHVEGSEIGRDLHLEKKDMRPFRTYLNMETSWQVPFRAWNGFFCVVVVMIVL